ncbi:MAG: sulfotransferase family protein [Acidimicrobiales bacterium]
MSRAASAWRDRVVFVVGARRSGTNWLSRTLGAHPHVGTIPGETFLFSDGIRPLADRVQHGLPGSARTGVTYMGRDAFLDATRAFCDAVFDGLADVVGVPAGGRIVERTPAHARHLDLMGAVYPDAWILHIVRDGRDVARSLVSQTWGPGSVAEAAAEWDETVRAARRAGSELDRYREVRYEDLVREPAEHLAAILRWLGLEAGETELAPVLREAGATYNVDASYPDVRAGKWAEAFGPADVSAFESVAGDLLAELGYAQAGAGDADPPSAAADAAPDRGGAAPLREPAPAPVRRLVAALRGAREGRSRRPGDAQRQVRQRLDEGQLLVEAFMGDVAARRFDDLHRHCAADVQVRSDVAEAGGGWADRGLDAVRRLGAELAADEALAGRQVRGQVYPGVPGYTVVAVFETEDGQQRSFTFVLGMAGGAVTQLAVHRG